MYRVWKSPQIKKRNQKIKIVDRYLHEMQFFLRSIFIFKEENPLTSYTNTKMNPFLLVFRDGQKYTPLIATKLKKNQISQLVHKQIESTKCGITIKLIIRNTAPYKKYE